MKAWMIDNAYLVTLGCLAAIVVSCAVYTHGLRNAQHEGIQAAADAPEIRQSASPAAVAAPTPLPTIAPLGIRTTALVAPKAAWPLQGGVLRPFDRQTHVYWPELKAWHTHTGLDIAGEEGEQVKACMDGEVSHAAWDELWGWRVCIRHENDRETLYAGLESCIVGIGEQVRRGQTIGTLLKCVPCEAELKTHLHLEMLHDGERQDPEAALPEK
ncbi:MAG: M23 family metallopeptidase [Clostridia bacterium]|nr:M23 family metallopeptidase [Clostridia bacterium]